MKLFKYFLVCIIVAGLVACNSAGDKTSEKAGTSSDSSAIDSLKKQDNTIVVPDQPAGIDTPQAPEEVDNVTISPGGDTKEERKTVRGKVTGGNAPFSYALTVNGPGTLQVTLAPDKIGCNIRIGKIISPSGKTEGPFSKETKYKLTETGTYQIHVEHANAASAESCDFTLRMVTS